MKYIVFLPLAILSSVALAQDSVDSGDTAWILTSTALVLLMTLPGLALFYAGLVNYKNIASVLMHCFCIAALMSLLWALIGYSLAFSGTGAFIGNLDRFALSGIGDSLSGSLPESAFATFQMTFAIITPALIVGAYVERMKFSAVLLFSSLWLLAVYVPVTHWIWGGGFLQELGIYDFAGGLVVHATAGTAAIVLALRLGARKTFGKDLQTPVSPVLTAIGACLLWVGWFGFNGGSALAANGQAAMAILVTHLAAASGALVWILIEWIRYKNTSLVAATTGMVAGLATVTPASGFIGVPGAFILGLMGGIVCYYAVPLIRIKLKIDDSLDVFAVHGVGGVLGILLVALLATDAFDGNGLPEHATVSSQFLVQALGVLVVIAWTAIVSFVIVFITEKLVGLRVSSEQESEGLDIAEHRERAFDL